MKNSTKWVLLLLILAVLPASKTSAQVLLGLVDIPLEILDFDNPGNSEIEVNVLNETYKKKLNSSVLQLSFESEHSGEFAIDTETIDLSTLGSIPTILNVKVSYNPVAAGTHYNRLAIRGVNSVGENVLLAYVNLRGTKK